MCTAAEWALKCLVGDLASLLGTKENHILLNIRATTCFNLRLGLGKL